MQAKRSKRGMHFVIGAWLDGVMVLWCSVEQLAGCKQPGQLNQFFSRASTSRR